MNSQEITDTETAIRRHFPGMYRGCKPWVIGIDKTVKAALPHVDPKLIDAALRLRTRSNRYLAACVEGATRYTEHGNPSPFKVMAHEAEDAARLATFIRGEQRRNGRNRQMVGFASIENLSAHGSLAETPATVEAEREPAISAPLEPDERAAPRVGF